MKFQKTLFPSNFTDQGELYITYRELEKIFGTPYHGPGSAAAHPEDLALVLCTCQWRLKYEDGTIALIYDRKTQITPMQPFRWTVGGISGKSFKLVKNTIKQYRDSIKSFSDS